jgi:ABC-type multidrug transport system fused ATPase/permease subunit
VNQDPVLFCTSIAENIAFGVRNGAEADIVAAAKLANAHTFISKFPDGYGTVVGERGTRLSGGQQQRVAIARAIMKDPKILILDEATSSLDAHSEHLVQEALERLMAGRTTLVIAHCLSTVQNADIVMVMENGRIVSAAPHHILMQTNALYASLVNRQLRAFDSTRAHGDVVIPMQ